MSLYLDQLCLIGIWLDGASEGALDVDAPLTGEEDEGVEKSGDADENPAHVQKFLGAENEQPNVGDGTVYQHPRSLEG